MAMSEGEIRRILSPAIFPDEQDGLASYDDTVTWRQGETCAWLHGHFTADELEAIAAWMRREVPHD